MEITQLAESTSEPVNTGERYIPGMGGRIAAEHLVRYALAARHVEGKRVLDIASGEGYGSELLARTAESVVGVDIDEGAIKTARVKYASRKNLSFEVGDADAESFSFGSAQFDVIVCLETLEHVHRPANLIGEFSRLLTEDGILIISTPNVENYTERFSYNNPFHVHEFSFEEFSEVLSSRFASVTYNGQFSGPTSVVLPVDVTGTYTITNGKVSTDLQMQAESSVPHGVSKASPLYYVAVCSKGKNVPASRPQAFFNPVDWNSIEDEFLFRRIVESASVNESLLEQLLSTLSDFRQERHALQEARAQLELKTRGDDIRSAEQVETIRRAYRTLEDYHSILLDELAVSQAKASALESSTTWRMTSPLRRLISLFR